MEQRRLALAFALSLLVLFVYQRLLVPLYQKQAPPQPAIEHQAEEERQPARQMPVVEALGDGVAAPVEGDTVTVDTDVVRATFTPSGARLVTLELKRYPISVAAESPPLELVGAGLPVDGSQPAAADSPRLLPLALRVGSGPGDAGVIYRADRTALVLHGKERGEIVFTADRPDGTMVSKRYGFTGDGYLFDVDVVPPTAATLGLLLTAMPAESQHAPRPEVAIALVGNGLTQKTLDKVDQIGTLAGATWAGFAAQYFVAVLVSREGTAEARMVASPWGPVALMESGADAGGSGHFAVYMGPKDRETLATAGYNLGRALDFGWVWFIAVPLLYALRWLYHLTGNYGISIIVLTTGVKVVTIPLTRATFRNMREMQKLQPQMAKLRERYKDDAATLQQEVMELYRRHQLNPLSGCLPMILQIPIFIGLYNTLMYAIELRHAPFALWITDLSSPDRLMVAGIGIPVLTLLMGGSMLLQQWLAPQQGDPTQQRLMMIMPLVFTYMFIYLPAGLVLYWLVNNLMSIGQQYLMLRRS